MLDLGGGKYCTIVKAVLPISNLRNASSLPGIADSQGSQHAPSTMSRSSLFQNVVSGGLLVCAIVAVATMVRREVRPSLPINRTGASFRPLPPKDWVELRSSGNRLGAGIAALTIVEFVDFECPACRAFEATTLRPFLSSNAMDVALSVRQWPLDYHQFAKPMAIVGECAAEAGRFEAFYFYVFQVWDGTSLPEIKDLVSALGMPGEVELGECLQRPAIATILARDTEIARRIGGTGTPTLIIDGLLAVEIPTRAQLDSLLGLARLPRRSKQ